MCKVVQDEDDLLGVQEMLNGGIGGEELVLD